MLWAQLNHYVPQSVGKTPVYTSSSGILKPSSKILCDTDYDNMSLVHVSYLAVAMQSIYVLCLLL